MAGFTKITSNYIVWRTSSAYNFYRNLFILKHRKNQFSVYFKFIGTNSYFCMSYKTEGTVVDIFLHLSCTIWHKCPFGLECNCIEHKMNIRFQVSKHAKLNALELLKIGHYKEELIYSFDTWRYVLQLRRIIAFLETHMFLRWPLQKSELSQQRQQKGSLSHFFIIVSKRCVVLNKIHCIF